MDPLIHGYVHKSWHPNNHLGETLTPVYKRKKKKHWNVRKGKKNNPILASINAYRLNKKLNQVYWNIPKFP